MAATIQDLYLKYVNKVERSLENDRYFQYLYEIVRAGNTTLEQKNCVLHKQVDERWLTIIEDTLDHINTIIEKPRRFIDTKEELVPVDLARKITADSVRHLSQNTQFIAGTEDDSVMPTRILNVTTEESYNLYENRFIYHLIQHLVTFIDKRTDVIFWSTGDEITNSVKMSSQVDDAYEQIEYKLEMVVKNKQSYAENDSENMTVFMRIDRVRRMVMALRNSAFCSLMKGCSVVRSPIQRTNLMMKDPHYRACYKLWQFLESYDEVGYTIDAKDTALEIDEEYQIQMFTNLITNYTVFKSLVEGDPRKLSEVSARHHKQIKPKFIKKIEEQIVNDYDIPDVEIRKIIIEKVTQAQLDAEAELVEEIDRRMTADEGRVEAEEKLKAAQAMMEAALKENAETQAQNQRLRNQLAEAENRIAETENACIDADVQLENVRADLDNLRETSENEINELNQTLTEERAAREAAENTVAELTAALNALQAAHAEVTEALAAEKAARAEAERMASDQKIGREAAESTVVELRAALESSQNARADAIRHMTEAELARKDIEEELRETRQSLASAELAANAAQEQLTSMILLSRQDEIAREEAEAEAAHERELREEAEEAARQAREAYADVERAAHEAEETARNAVAERDRAVAEANAAVEKAQADATAAMEKVQADANVAVETALTEARELASRSQSEATAAVEKAQTEARAAVNKARTEANTAIEQALAEARELAARAQTEANAAVEKAQNETAAAVRQATLDRAAREAAERTASDAVSARNAAQASEANALKAAVTAEKARAEAEENAARQTEARLRAEEERDQSNLLRADAERLAQKANEARRTAETALEKAEKTAADAVHLRELVELRAGSDALGEFLRNRYNERVERKKQSRKDD